MAEAPDKESKTEQPTERRLRDALEKGNVPISRETPVFASLAGFLVALAFLLEWRGRDFVVFLARLLDEASGQPLEVSADVVLLSTTVLRGSLLFAAPIVLVMLVLGIVASLVQNPPHLAFERIKPDASRISIKSGWSRVFGLRGQTDFLKALLKLVGVATVAAVLIRSEEPYALATMFADPRDVPARVIASVIRLLSGITVAAGIIFAIDLVWSRLHWQRDLRMTRQEVKDEFKELEGDPLVKARLRSIALDRSRRRMIAAVPRATMVIANPTHYAIALRYVREEGSAPRVLAKGQDHLALKIREIAEAHGIPVIEDKALARSMYDAVEVDQLIPPAFYRAVAELIHFLQSRKRGATSPAKVRT